MNSLDIILLYSHMVSLGHPENVQGLSLEHLRSRTQPLQVITGEYPEFSACLKTVYLGVHRPEKVKVPVYCFEGENSTDCRVKATAYYQLITIRLPFTVTILMHLVSSETETHPCVCACT